MKLKLRYGVGLGSRSDISNECAVKLPYISKERKTERERIVC